MGGGGYSRQVLVHRGTGDFWRIVRTAPVEQVAAGDLTAPLLLGAAGIPDGLD